jgi:uncharacterized protein (DUF2141 family)
MARASANTFANTLAGIVMLLAAAATPGSAQTAAPSAQATPAAAVLRVRVVDLRNANGQVVCTLFNSPGAFPSDSTKAVAQIAVSIKDNGAVCNFGALTPGMYALVVFHDENGNGKFDRSWLGLPKEGYAFSNNVRPVFKPPSFKAAAFDYTGADQWLTLVMRY